MIVRQHFPDLFLIDALPALDEVIFARYNRFPPQFVNVFREMTSTRWGEQTTEITGIGLPQVTAEGADTTYDQPAQGFDKTYNHGQWSLGFQFSRIAIDDDRWGIVRRMATELGKSFAEGREIFVAGVFNNGFSGSYLGPDGVPLFSASHPQAKAGGVFSNLAAVASDIDVPSLEIGLTAMRQTRDHSNKRIRLPARKAIVPNTLEFAVAEILSGMWRSDTANRTVNAFKHRSGMPNFSQYFVWDYLDDTDAWMLQADIEDTELRYYQREAFNTTHEVHHDSRTVKTAGWERNSVGWSNPFGIWGNPGA